MHVRIGTLEGVSQRQVHECGTNGSSVTLGPGDKAHCDGARLQIVPKSAWSSGLSLFSAGNAIKTEKRSETPKDTAYVSDTLSHRIHVWVYLPTFTIKRQPNAGKCTIHGSHGFSTTFRLTFCFTKGMI